MSAQARIYVAGHGGLVGSAIVRCLREQGYAEPLTRSHAELDLCDQVAVSRFFCEERPEYVFLAAAKVGGIHANNTFPADFITVNLQIQTNVIHAAWRSGVKRLLFLGSSCIYPRDCPQPIREEYLLTGPLETTNEPYAVAKIAGIKMCEAYNRQYGTSYVSLMPTNLYGIYDNFDLENSHVIPALIRKFHEAKLSGAPAVSVWGSGEPRREFLHVDDLAAACVHVMALIGHTEMVNVGTGEDLKISELARLVADVVGYKGNIVFDRDKPDGTPRKLLDVSRIRGLGWQPMIELRTGLAEVYEWYVKHGAACLST
ncbi:MAG: GDP-L-fucose synthase [Methylococcaceae bacterium]|nr:MAG: GDP-L-fucose synthase [Methylococcaceae bacterium]